MPLAGLGDSVDPWKRVSLQTEPPNVSDAISVLYITYVIIVVCLSVSVHRVSEEIWGKFACRKYAPSVGNVCIRRV